MELKWYGIGFVGTNQNYVGSQTEMWTKFQQTINILLCMHENCFSFDDLVPRPVLDFASGPYQGNFVAQDSCFSCIFKT